MVYFTGDVNLTENSFDVGFGVGSLVSKGYNPFKNMHKNEHDIWIGNFEGVCSNESELKGYAKNTFRIQAEYLNNICGLIDYFGIANNHVMEHGSNAYKQMQVALKNAGFGVFGSKAEKSVSFNHSGKNISVMGFSMRNDQLEFNPLYWNFPSCEEIKKEFQRIKTSDYKIAYLHWGVEFIDHPYHDQKLFAHWLVDLGFDLIIGMHPHVMQGSEVYKGKHIFYSLGNFVFDMAWEPTKYGLVVKLDVESGEVGYEYIKIDNCFSPVLISESDVPESWRMGVLCNNLNKNENIELYISEASRGLKEYRMSNYKYMIKHITKYDFGVFRAMIKDFIKRRFFGYAYTYKN